MSDVLEVGGIEAKLTVDTTQFESGMERSGEQMKGLYTRINTLPPAIQKLQLQEEKLSRAMEEQIRKVAEMEDELVKAERRYTSWEAIRRESDNQKFAKALEQDRKALAQAGEKITQYQYKLEQLDAQKQEAMEKYNASAAKSAETQGYKNSSLAIDSVANSLRALSPVLGDSVSGVGNLAERIVFMKKAMQEAGSGGAAMGAGILGGISLAVVGVSMLTQAWQDAEAEREQAVEEAQQWLADHDEQVQQLTQSVHVLDDQLSSLDDVISARETLADLFPNMVLGYTDEGEAILANNKALEKQVDLLKEKADLNDQIMAYASTDYLDEYNYLVNPSGLDNLVYTIQHHLWDWAPWDSKGAERYNLRINAEKQLQAIQMENSAINAYSAYLRTHIDGYRELSVEYQTVIDTMIAKSAEAAFATGDTASAYAYLDQSLADINALLGDRNALEAAYNDILQSQEGYQAQLEAEQRERVATLYDSIVDKYKDEAEKDYKDETATIKDELNQQYNNQKATLEAEYEATRDSLQARQKAYQSLTFNVTSLDEQALANKMDLLDRQAAAEEDAQVRAIQAVQRRYYEEARLIIETANAEIQAYNDRLAALDEADRQAEEARKARQNQNKLRDLNESYAKQQAENEREMQEALEAYEEQRAVLEEAIAHPASLTHEKLARQQLAELEKKWAEEREGLERDHADKLLTIQRQLDEEKLSQQEEAEADQRQAERESLNEQIKDLESNAQQQLAALNNQYSVEKEIQAKAISDQLEAAQKGYQDQLEALNNWKEETLSAELDAAEKRRDAAITEEKLTAKAIEDLEKLSYDERLRLLDEYGVSAEEKAKAINEKIWAAFNEGKSQQTTGPLTYEDTIKQMAPWVLDPSLLPGYASGGIVSSPTLAWVGEGSEPEAIMPLSRVADIVNAALEGRTRANQELMQRAYEAMLPYRAITSGGLIQNNNQRTSETNIHIDTVEINNANQLRAAITQLTSVGGGA